MGKTSHLQNIVHHQSVVFVRLAGTIYSNSINLIRCIYSMLGREITNSTVIHGVYIRSGQPYVLVPPNLRLRS
jgi:hypothetical protein